MKCEGHIYVPISGLNLNKRNICGTCHKERKSTAEVLYKRELGWNGIYICLSCLQKKIAVEKQAAQKEKEEKKAAQQQKEATQQKKTEKQYNFKQPELRFRRNPSVKKQEVSAFLQWAAKHPFQGGGFSGK